MANKLISNYLPEFMALLFNRSKPAMVTVNLTNKCNQQCVYCEIGSGLIQQENQSLSYEDIIWIIDEMELNKIRKISFCGGEPFLFDGLIQLIEYAGKKNIRSSITTNGMTAFNLSKKDLNALKNNKTEINISIDSFEDEVQTLTRGNPKALINPLKSVEILKEHNIPITILTAISKYNYSGLYQFIKQAHKKGFTQVLFQPIIYYTNYPGQAVIDNKSQLNVSTEQLEFLIGELKRIFKFEKQHNIKTNVYRIIPWIKEYITTANMETRNWFFEEVLNKFYCREIYAIIDITYNGGIQPCGLSPASLNIRNNRELGLIKLWENATKKIKSDLQKKKYHTYCNGCCHHFSRNMLASIVKHPFQNRKALMTVASYSVPRLMHNIIK